MTIYELRQHLIADHDVRILGADEPTLVIVHQVVHRDIDNEHAHRADHLLHQPDDDCGIPGCPGDPEWKR